MDIWVYFPDQDVVRHTIRPLQVHFVAVAVCCVCFSVGKKSEFDVYHEVATPDLPKTFKKDSGLIGSRSSSCHVFVVINLG